MKLKRFLALGPLLFLTLGVFVHSVQAQAKNNSQSITIQIVAYVPPTLRLDLDFSRDGSLQLSGKVRGEESPDSRGSQAFLQDAAGHSVFDISSGATIPIGNASLFSNLPGFYSIVVFSANGGFLRSRTSESDVLIPYQLMLGDRLSSARQGSFSFALGGKAGKNSPDFPVALSIGEFQAAQGDYSDSLSFSIFAG